VSSPWCVGVLLGQALGRAGEPCLDDQLVEFRDVDPLVPVDSLPDVKRLLYGEGMAKTVTIRVPEEVHARLQARADADGTTVTAILTEAALRDPRLTDPTSLIRAAEWARDHAGEFAEFFPDEEPVPGAEAA
jgi:predicted transcriptional regulator